IDFVSGRPGGVGGRVTVPNMGEPYKQTGPIYLRSHVTLEGTDSPTLRLADNINSNMITVDGFADLRAAAVGGGITGYAIRGLTLDGNRDGNTAAATSDYGNVI